MAETNISRDREQDPADAPEPAHGMEALPEEAGELSTPEAVATPEAKEAESAAGSPEALPEPAEAASINDFAESVIFGFEQAGLDIEEPKHAELFDLAEHAPPPEEPHENDQDETFFAGWDGLDDFEEPVASEAQPSELHRIRLSDINMESAEPAIFAGDAGDEDVSGKHDALAEAVQSALLSIYGDTSSPARDAGEQYSPFARGVGAEPAEAAPAVQAAQYGDSLSPQDVILNYFSYTPEDDDAGGASHRDSYERGQESGRDDLGPRFSTFARNADYSEEALFQSVSQFTGEGEQKSHSEAVRYDGPPAFPVPAAALPRQEEPNARDNGRLLGAAGIGLVGGIAIAAALAVFVLNSYGPLPGTPEGDASQNGEVSARGGDAQRSAKLPDAMGDVSAADVAGAPGQAVALIISAQSPHPSEQTLISITGVPEGARLSAGVDAGAGDWLLPPRRLNGLTIHLPADAHDAIPINVQLLDSNVRTPLSEKKRFLVHVNPAAAAPNLQASLQNAASKLAAQDAGSMREPDRNPSPAPAFNTQTLPQPVAQAQTPAAGSEGRGQQAAGFNTQTIALAQPGGAAPNPRTAALAEGALAPAAPAKEAQRRKSTPQADIDDLIRDGNKRMREGDILKAREMYQKAVDMGDPEAALAMGRSFDPIYFERIENKNAEPDAAKAFDWYKQAMDSGAAQTAKVRIENLRHFLNE